MAACARAYASDWHFNANQSAHVNRNDRVIREAANEQRQSARTGSLTFSTAMEGHHWCRRRTSPGRIVSRVARQAMASFAWKPTNGGQGWPLVS